MDSIEPTTTHSWILILRVGKTHIHVIKIYQPLSTRVFSQFIRPPYTQFRLHIHRFVVTRHLIMWPPTRAQPLSRPETSIIRIHITLEPSHSIPHLITHSIYKQIASVAVCTPSHVHKCIPNGKQELQSLNQTVPRLQLQSSSANTSIRFIFHKLKETHALVFSRTLWLIHLFILIIIFQIARKQLSQNDNTSCVTNDSSSSGPQLPSVLPSHSSCRYSPFSRSSAMDHWN